MTTLKPVLYVEDDKNDALLMERAFKQVEVANPLKITRDGELAIEYLSGPAKDAGANADPCLIMLDLSMPGKNGLEVLKWIRSDPKHTNVPVIVLTSSNQESDINRAFHLRANGFINKPGDTNKLLSMVKAIKEYWLSEAKPVEPFTDFAAAKNVPVVQRPSHGHSPG
jgi:two-component system response regulator